MASQGHFAPSQGRDSWFAAASVIVIISRRHHRARRRICVFYRNNLRTGSFSPLSVIVITRRASILPRSKGGALARANAVPDGGNLTGSDGILVATSTMGVQVCVSCGISRLSAENRGQKMDEFLSIEDLRWEFGASRAWMYKYLAPHIKSITVKCSTDDGERLCKRYSLDDARRVVAEKARAEVYSVPVKADPGKSSYAPYRRPRRVRIKTSAYIAEYIVGFGHLWQIDEIAEECCGKRSREAAYQFIYRNAWIAIVFGNKTFYIPRRTTPQFVAAAVEVFGDAAHTVEYARGGHKSDATE